MVAEMLPYFEGNEIPDYGKDNLWFFYEHLTRRKT